RYDKGVEVRHRGPRAPSAAHIDMTVRMLRDAGASVEAWAQEDGASRPGVPDTWRVHPGGVRGQHAVVQPDVSNALPCLAAALVTGGTLTVRDWPRATAQPAGLILGLLADLGAGCELSERGLAVTGTGQIRGITAELADVGEAVPVLA